MNHDQSAPFPDFSIPLSIHGEVVVEEYSSEDQFYRLAITRETEIPRYRVRVFRWCSEDWSLGGSVFWMSVDKFTTIVDSLSSARSLIEEQLRELS